MNTDFAETEVDTRQLNLTRFELFFPERRTFFLEGSNQYQFGLGLDEQFLPFFSRRIGLFEGEQTPINAGVKLNGRVGRWNVGLLDVQTRDKVLRDGELVRATNLFASRVSYDLTPKLRIGSIVANGSPDGISRNMHSQGSTGSTEPRNFSPIRICSSVHGPPSPPATLRLATAPAMVSRSTTPMTVGTVSFRSTSTANRSIPRSASSLARESIAQMRPVSSNRDRAKTVRSDGSASSSWIIASTA